MRVGIVGLGKMGLLHASLVKVMPGVELAAVCEKATLTRMLAKKVFKKIPVVRDVSELVDLNLDAIYVTTPTPSHFGVVKQIYEEKLARNVFVEKPLASRYDDSKQLSQLASQDGWANMVGYVRRFMVTFLKARELLSQDVIGEPMSFAMNAFSSDFYGAQNNDPAMVARGGVMNDLGCHAIDLALWLFGDLRLNSAKLESLTAPPVEDTVHFTLQCDSSGLEGTVYVSWCMEGYRIPEVDILAKGSEGTLEVNDDKLSLCPAGKERKVWHKHDLNDRAEFWLGAPEYYREDAYFLSRVAAKSGAEPSFQDALKVDLLIDSVQKKANGYD